MHFVVVKSMDHGSCIIGHGSVLCGSVGHRPTTHCLLWSTLQHTRRRLAAAGLIFTYFMTYFHLLSLEQRIWSELTSHNSFSLNRDQNDRAKRSVYNNRNSVCHTREVSRRYNIVSYASFSHRSERRNTGIFILRRAF